jgi:hypothetical protein
LATNLVAPSSKLAPDVQIALTLLDIRARIEKMDAPALAKKIYILADAMSPVPPPPISPLPPELDFPAVADRVMGELAKFGMNVVTTSVGALIQNEGLEIPAPDRLRKEVADLLESDPRQAAAAADLLGVAREFALAPGRLAVAHPFKQYSVQAAAWRLGVPLTGHPMIGHDIIYVHPMNHCAAIGRCAQRDFLTFAQSVSNLDGGVYMSIGSAVMSPMIFEKSLSMSQIFAR